VLNPPNFIQEPSPLKRLFLEVYDPECMVQKDYLLHLKDHQVWKWFHCGDLSGLCDN